MAVWSDSTFTNINSGGSYATVGASGDHWDPATPAGIKESFGFAGVFSVRTTTASTGDQYVKIVSPNATQEWMLGVRCLSTATSDPVTNGYVARQAGGYIWWHNGSTTQVDVHGVTMPTTTTTLELRVVGTVCTVYVNGSSIDSYNFSAAPKTGQYTGFGASNNAVVVSAEGGDVGGAATVPAQVTGLVATGGVGTHIDLTWTVPDNGGAAISGFRIRRAPDVSGSPGTFSTLVASTGSVTAAYSDTGLTLGDHWWYAVAAINSVGTGTESTPDDAVAANPPPPAFTEDFSNGLKNWTISRWKSQMSQGGHPGFVPSSSNDDGHYDGVAGTHTTPTGTGILPPYDIFVGSNNWLYVGGGSQNYGDTFLRCAQKMDLTGSGPWTIRLGLVPNRNIGVSGESGGLYGWSTLYATDLPQPSPSMTGENSAGPVPQHGFSIRFDYSSVYDGVNYHPAPMAVTYNNYVEATDGNAVPIFTISETAIVDAVVTFTRTNVRITANGVTWFDRPWTLPSALTSAWMYLGAHNHATRKYAPYSDSRGAVYSYFNFDGPVITPQYSYAVPDSLVYVPAPSTGEPEAGGGDGMIVGWGSPTGTLTIPGVPANVSAAKLLMSSHWVPNTPDTSQYFVRYSLNGNATHDASPISRAPLAGSFAYAISVNPAELITGDNTVSITMVGQVGSFAPYVGNISLLVESFSVGQIAVGATILPKMAIGGTAVRSLALGATEIWRAPLPPQVPTFPTLITLIAGSGTLAARWSQPVDRGAALTDYLIQYRTSPSGTYTAFTHTAGWARTVTITGLANNAAYDVRVAAINSVGTGAFSNVVTTTTTGPPTAPAAPVLTATAGNTQVVLNWTAPSNGGSAITNYLLETSANGTSGWSTVTTINALTYTHTGRTNGTIYYYRVSAINTVGTGTASNVANATPAVPTGALYTDNFNRSNGALGSPWVVFDGGLLVASNACKPPDTGLHTSRYNQTFAADQWAEGDLTGVGAGICGPCVRFTSGGDFYYTWVNAGPIAIFKRVSNTYTQVGSNGPTATASAKYRLEAQGTTLRLYINGTLTITATDSPGITTGQAGLLGANSSTVTLDNFRCGDLPYTP